MNETKALVHSTFTVVVFEHGLNVQYAQFLCAKIPLSLIKCVCVCKALCKWTLTVYTEHKLIYIPEAKVKAKTKVMTHFFFGVLKG